MWIIESGRFKQFITYLCKCLDKSSFRSTSKYKRLLKESTNIFSGEDSSDGSLFPWTQLNDSPFIMEKEIP